MSWPNGFIHSWRSAIRRATAFGATLRQSVCLPEARILFPITLSSDFDHTLVFCRRQAILAPVSDVTQLLSAIDAGDPKASDQLLPLVYEELRKLAAVKIAQEKPGQTLQATALVHEAWLRLVGSEEQKPGTAAAISLAPPPRRCAGSSWTGRERKAAFVMAVSWNA